MAEGSVAPSCLADRRWLHRELSPGRRRDHDHSCSKTPRAWDATGANRNHPKRALLIDDDNGVRNVIFDIVTSFGYVTDAAANGPEGLALFEKNLYDNRLDRSPDARHDGLGSAPGVAPAGPEDPGGYRDGR